MARKYLFSGTVDNLGDSALPPFDSKNDEYPLSRFAGMKYHLPDFTRAVEMSSSIYKINSPGFFFRVASVSAKTGVVVDPWAQRMGTVDLSTIAVKTTVDDDDKKGETGHVAYVGGVCGCNISSIATVIDWGPINPPEYARTDDGLRDQCTFTTIASKNFEFCGRIDENSGLEYDVGMASSEPSHKYAVIFNQRALPEYFDGRASTGNLRCTYVVGAGNSQSGGNISATLVPILPGIDNRYSDDATGAKVFPINCSPKALSVFYHTETDGKKQYYNTKIAKVTDECNAGGPPAELIETDLYGEVIATYVYYYTSDAINRNTWFVPTNASNQSYPAVTKIRDVTNGFSCTYNLPAYSTSVYDHSMCIPAVAIATFAKDHQMENAHNKSFKEYVSISTMNGTSISIPNMILWWKTDNSVHQAPVEDSLNGPPIIINAHKVPFDGIFSSAFTGTSIDGHYEKFLAMQLNLKPYNYSKTYSGYSDALEATTGHATPTIYDPANNTAIPAV